MIGKRQLIDNVNNITSYTISHNNMYVLRIGLLGSSIVESVGFIGEEAKSYTCRNLKTMGKSINLAFYIWIVIEHIAIEVTKLKYILL